MSTVTELTYDQYVAVVTLGGKAFAFRSHECGGHVPDKEFAHESLVERGFYDKVPDDEDLRDVYYTLAE